MEHGLALIEDCAQAHGALYEGRKVGSIGKVSAFSFYPSKNLGACGEAGAVGTDEKKVAQLVEMFRSHGSKTKYSHEILGYNDGWMGFRVLYCPSNFGISINGIKERARFQRRTLGG